MDQELTDHHVHLQNPLFGGDLGIVFDRSRKNGITRWICCATAPGEWSRIKEIGSQYPEVLTAYGIHPWFVKGMSGDWETWLKILLDDRSGLTSYRPGLGEIGLDFAVRKETFPLQEEIFVKQLAIADERSLPVVIHSVRSVNRILDLIGSYSRIPLFLFHGFCGSGDQITRIIDRNGFFSFSLREIDEKNQKGRAAIQEVPRDRILLESDGPGKIPPRSILGGERNLISQLPLGPDHFLLNEPGMIPRTLQEIARIKKIDEDDLRNQIVINQARFLSSWKTKEV
ncbi:MAG: TatD family hydrolase [Planctomycetia bacterium]|nr:TatD family hydrolase [Planctomycetia bacterium]